MWLIKGCRRSLLLLLMMMALTNGLVLEGSQTSYAQFRQWHGGHNDTLAFEFSTQQKDALLLYTDNHQENEYVQIKLVDGNVMLRYNWGRGGQVISSPVETDKLWHRVEIVKNGGETTLVVDRTKKTLRSNGNHKVGDNEKATKQYGPRKDSDTLAFGDKQSNGYVFVGGLPSWYSEKMDSVVLPTTLLEPRLRGSVRSLKYRDMRSPSERQQDMMAYKGVRSSTVDACAHGNPCKNGGQCIATDQGPVCDCSKTDFQGVFCQEDNPAPEVTLRGTEYITYDLQQKFLEPILSVNDEISLHFKTRKSSGLLFYTGSGLDYMNLALQDGGVALTVKLGIGKLDTQIKTDSVRFDDNQWHHVLVQRESTKVTLTVDGIYTERWMGSGGFSFLASTTAFLGGSEATYSLPGTKTNNNLVGCLKKVTYRADSLVLDFLKLAQDGNPMFSVIGELEWKCQDIGPGSPLAFKSNGNYMSSSLNVAQKEQGGVISFTRDEAFLVLPSWKTTISGSISLKFRTNEAHGLLLFNGGGSPGKDFFAMELFDGHLFVHLDLGTGAAKVRASRKPLNDGDWHRVELTLKNKVGRITVDGNTEAFESPGESNKLDLVGSLFVGSVDYMDPYLRLPSEVWTATLRYGFVGCLKDLYINGAPIDIVTYAHQQDVGFCHDRPCMHGGKCTEGWNRYICDCSQTSFSGATCGNSAATLKFTGTESMSLRYSESMTSEADNLNIRFRTVEQNGVLLVSRHDRSQDKLEIVLEGGRVKISIYIGLAEKSFYVGQSLNDDMYHSLIYQRRGMKIHSVVDDDTPVLAEIVGTQSEMGFTELHVGGIEVGSMVTSNAPGFRGSLQQLSFNGEKLFELANTGQLAIKHTITAQVVEGNNEETVHHAVSFAAQNTYLGLPQMKVYNSINIRLQFRTFEQNGLIFFNAGKASDFIALELVKGRLYYVLNLGYGPISIKDNTSDMGHLSDNKWHTVIIGRPSRYKHTLMVDGHIATATTRGDNYLLDLDGILYLGGVRTNMYTTMPRPLLSKSGFQGCIASFETNGELEDPIKHALVPSPLVEDGCEEAVAYEWGDKGGVMEYTYPADKRPDTSEDVLSLGFISPSFDAVLVRIDSDPKMRVDDDPNKNNDYLQLEINGGKLFLNYNLGSKDITIGDLYTKVNDGRYHVVRFTRSDTNSSMQVDDNPIYTKFPQGTKQLSKMTVFNDQATIQVGGHKNKNFVERPFRGVLAGVSFNGLRPLDLAASNDPKVEVSGDVRKLNNIPFDYKESHPYLFTKEAIIKQIDIIHNNRNHGLPQDRSGLPRAGIGIINCDDEEDCIQGSGSGEGSPNHFQGGSNAPQKSGIGAGSNDPSATDEEVWYPRGTDSRYVPLPTTAPHDTTFTTSNWAILLYPEPTKSTELATYNPPSMLPVPPEDYDIITTNVNKDKTSDTAHYEEFDQKWNVDETPEDEDDYPDITPSKEKSMPGTMVLVIGIILGAFIAMILIVIFVLKIRVRVDGQHVKCSEEAAPRYQFAPPNDYGELGGEQETATTSLMEGSVAPPGVAPVLNPGGMNIHPSGMYNNGMFNNNCPPPPQPPTNAVGGLPRPLQPPPPSASNGGGGGAPANSRLFRKSNGSKPVRECDI